MIFECDVAQLLIFLMHGARATQKSLFSNESEIPGIPRFTNSRQLPAFLEEQLVSNYITRLEVTLTYLRRATIKVVVWFAYFIKFYNCK